MQEAIATRFPNCTILSVMHRLDSIRSFDKVVVLHQGDIVEHDGPDKLLAEGSDSRLLAMYKAGGYSNIGKHGK
jgi:ATP-binding cassette, subfamily C (CFTR/MRP), member 1